MPNPLVGLVGGSTLTGLFSGAAQNRAAGKAAGAQVASANMSIDEQRRQFEEIQRLMAPYVAAGAPALAGQQALIGQAGLPAQQQAIAQLQQGPQFGALVQQGENAILQNASATGGLRGGNVQGALAQFRPQILSQLIEQQFGRLGGLASLGQNAAAMQGNAGLQTGQQIAGQFGNIGQAQAGAALARGQNQAAMFNLPLQGFGLFAGLGGAQGIKGLL